MSANDGKVRLRDRREPGHFWADNEIIDVFGDELGQNGISVYMTMTRFCYGAEVKLSLREIAAAARMSKDTVSRSMKVLVALGLVIESKGAKAKTVSTWSLANVKALVQGFVRESVSQQDRWKPLQARESASHGASSTLVQLVKEQRGNCLMERQMEKEEVGARSATDLSQTEAGFETDLSQNEGSHLYSKTQDTKLQDTTPIPPSQANGECGDCDIVDGKRRCTMNCGPCEPREAEDSTKCAVRKVMRELNLTERRMVAVIQRAIEGYRAKTDQPPNCNRVAEVMIQARQEYLGYGDLLEYQVGPRKFFANGLWLDSRQWVLDKKELQRQRRL